MGRVKCVFRSSQLEPGEPATREEAGTLEQHGFRDNYLFNANAIYLLTVEGCKVGGCGREGGGFEISGGKGREGREGNAEYLALHRYCQNDPDSQYDDQGLLQGYKAAE